MSEQRERVAKETMATLGPVLSGQLSLTCVVFSSPPPAPPSRQPAVPCDSPRTRLSQSATPSGPVPPCCSAAVIAAALRCIEERPERGDQQGTTHKEYVNSKEAILNAAPCCGMGSCHCHPLSCLGHWQGLPRTRTWRKADFHSSTWTYINIGGPRRRRPPGAACQKRRSGRGRLLSCR